MLSTPSGGGGLTGFPIQELQSGSVLRRKPADYPPGADRRSASRGGAQLNRPTLTRLCPTNKPETRLPVPPRRECDETHALLRLGNASRRKNVLAEKERRQGEAGLDLRGRGFVALGPSPKKRREDEQPVLVRVAGVAGDGAPGFWGNIDQVLRRAGGGAAREVEADPELGEKRHLEAHEQRRRQIRIGEMVGQHGGRVVEARVRIPLGQETQESRHGGDTVECDR